VARSNARCGALSKPFLIVFDRMTLFLPTNGDKKSRPWLGRLFAFAKVCYFLTLTVAILTTN